MSQSDDPMARLDRLEGAVVKISEILVLQNQRLDDVNRRLDDANQRLDDLTGEVRGLREETHAMHDGLATRLDRLIAATLQERSLGAERLLDFERRLSKLEERVGV